MRKVLYVANITQHIIRFHLPYLKWFKQNGFEVHVAANGIDEIENCDVLHAISVQRTPFSTKNYEAYKKLKSIIETNNYDFVIGNTSIAAGLMRLAARSARRSGTKVIFFCHGLNIYKGAPFKSWITFYPLERFFSLFTDISISINTEDYNRLLAWNAGNVFKINGVGVDPARFIPVTTETKIALRKHYGYSEDDFILVYMAEFIHRKNHKFLIKSATELSRRIPEIKFLFLGRGILLEEMKLLAQQNGVEKLIDFTGFRTDVPALVGISDIGISASKVEGLGLNIVENMFMGLPVVASVDKGHKELIRHGVNGFLFEQDSREQFIDYICKIAEDSDLRQEMGKNSIELARKFSIQNSLQQFSAILKPYF
jgi:glycosyltransferase EpsD